MLALFYFLRRCAKNLLKILAIMPVTAFSALVNAEITEDITYLHNDLSGSVKAASNSTGQLLWRQEYQPTAPRLLPPVSALASCFKRYFG